MEPAAGSSSQPQKARVNKRKCYMEGCVGTGPRKLFQFPSDKDRRAMWIEACGGQKCKEKLAYVKPESAHVCELHFEKHHIKGRSLNDFAIPLPYRPPSPRPPAGSAAQGGLHSLSDNQGVNEFKVVQVAPSYYAAHSTNNEQRNKDKNVTDDAAMNQLNGLLEFQYKISKMKTTNYMDFLNYSLHLYLEMPMTYKVLKNMMSLPVTKSFRKLDFNLNSYMSDQVKLLLKNKVNSLQERDRYCTFCVKKMPLQRFLYYRIGKDRIIGLHEVNGRMKSAVATHAIVVVARGLRSAWSQTLAYCFVAHSIVAEVNALLDNTIQITTDIGYTVVAVVMDPEDLLQNRIVSVVQPYYLLREKEVYCILNLPQLIISLRDTLMSQELQFRDGGETVVASWDTIRELYERYAVDDRRTLLKLTRSHVDPDEDEKKQLKYAVEVFSKSVWQALELESASRGEAGRRVRGTRRLIQLVSDVLDILNSYNNIKRTFSGDAHQMKAIRQLIELLTYVKPLKPETSESLACIDGLRITIMSFSLLLRDLLPKGITSLATDRFNLDTVDKFFSAVKESAKPRKPTAVDFFKCFRLAFVNDLVKFPKNTASTKDNVRNFIQHSRNKNQISRSVDKSLSVGTVDYRYPVPQTRPFLRLCWYLLKKSCEVHECYIFCRKFGLEGVCWDTYFQPPQAFADFVLKLEKAFFITFRLNLKVRMGHSLLIKMPSDGHNICPCFPIAYVLKLYIRVRIFQICRFNNRRFLDRSLELSTRDEVVQDWMANAD